MRVGFIMEEPDPALVTEPDTPVDVLAWMLRRDAGSFVAVVDSERQWLGAVRAKNWRPGQTLQDIMTPKERVPQLDPDDTLDAARRLAARFEDWPIIPVIRGTTLVGALRVADLPDEAPTPLPDWSVPVEVLQQQLVAAMFSGLLLLDPEGRVRLLNPRGGEILGADPAALLGRPYAEVAQYMFPHMSQYLSQSVVPRVLANKVERQTVTLPLVNGRDVLFHVSAVRDQRRLVAVLITFADVTQLHEAERRARHEAEEAEKAFGLTLPNSKVEAKLKSSPEFQDIFDAASGTATVTAVIPDGTYRHVINGLRIMAELNTLGLFQLVGLDKDTLVSAFIFHDLGKEQPRLALGQKFRPADTFEPSRRHAERSADWAVKYYHVPDDVAALIRHHHTPLADLPAEFPTALIPMLRIMQLVDGLSAGLTRRLSAVGPFQLEGTSLTVREYNRDSRYHRSYRLAVLSGREQILHELNPDPPLLGDLERARPVMR